MTELLTKIQDVLPEIDTPPKQLRSLSKESRNEVLEQRRTIIRTLVDNVKVYANAQVKIEGLLDGSEAAQFDLHDLSTPLGVL